MVTLNDLLTTYLDRARDAAHSQLAAAQELTYCLDRIAELTLPAATPTAQATSTLKPEPTRFNP